MIGMHSEVLSGDLGKVVKLMTSHHVLTDAEKAHLLKNAFKP